MSATIAFQGAVGAFSEEAAGAFAARAGWPGAELLPCQRLDTVFDAVRDGLARAGVVPIENTLAGSVQPCYDLLRASGLTIVAELVQRISHALVAAAGVGIDDLRRVLSHPVALAQCTAFFRAHPDLEIVAVYDTAGAVADVIASGSRHDAAIASARTATIYGGSVLAERLEDDPQNFTRFLAIARSADPIPVPPTDGYKTSVVFTLANKPGALHDALGPLADHTVDLTLIESRPQRGSPFEYAFYVDLAGRADDDAVRAALDALAGRAESLQVLGSYPRAVTRTGTGAGAPGGPPA